MSERAFPVKFIREGGITYPVDTELHNLAVAFADRELAQKVNLGDFSDLWASCVVDAEGKPVSVTGLISVVSKADIPLVRFTTSEAGDVLIERVRGFLEDKGFRGMEVFVHVAPNEPRETRCPRWKRFLKKIKATKANRWSVVV